MPSLTTCLREAAKFLPPDMVASVTKRAAEMRAEGVPADQIGRMAVAEHAKRATDDLATVETAARDGVTLYHPAKETAAPGEGARPAAAAPDVRVPTGEFDAVTGVERTASAAEHIEAARAEAERVRATAQGLMDTAATCLMGGL